MQSLTMKLVRQIRQKPVLQADLERAAYYLLDSVANIIAGRASVAGRRLLAFASGLSSTGRLVDLDKARQGFLLGGLCHILEMDDLHRSSVVHPGCVTAPVILALCASGDGGRALTAYLHGNEAAYRVGMAVGEGHYRIWHNTATCGPFGSAMAAAYLFGLDEAQSVHALGNAGSQSAGLWEFLETGANTKHMHAGRGAEAGMIAAMLAAHGFTGPPRILEGKKGFFAATCTDSDAARLELAESEGWQIHENSVKPWPSCRHTHPAIDAALRVHALMREQGRTPQTIERVTVASYPAGMALCDRPRPDSVYAAKFSLQHCVAAALAEGQVGFSEFESGTRDKCVDLREKIELELSRELTAAYPRSWGGMVSVRFAGGGEISQAVSEAKGDPALPLTQDELKQKANMLMAHGGFDDGARLADQILAMADGGPVPDIIALLDKGCVAL